MVFFIGSSFTVMSSILFTLYYLAKCPDVQEKAYNEVYTELGQNTAYKYFNNLEYLKLVIREVQRITNAGTLVVRSAEKDMEIAGHSISAGTRIIIPLNVINHDLRIYTDPSKFNPETERFSEENKPRMPHIPNITFGFGKRMCPGMHMAKVELLVGIAVILRSLKLELRPGHPNVSRFYAVSVLPDSEIVVQVTPRQ